METIKHSTRFKLIKNLLVLQPDGWKSYKNNFNNTDKDNLNYRDFGFNSFIPDGPLGIL